jgi:hypothetical protein
MDDRTRRAGDPRRDHRAVLPRVRVASGVNDRTRCSRPLIIRSRSHSPVPALNSDRAYLFNLAEESIPETQANRSHS